MFDASTIESNQLTVFHWLLLYILYIVLLVPMLVFFTISWIMGPVEPESIMELENL